MLCAAFGRPESVIELHAMNSRQERRYRAWAEPFFTAVGGRVGSLGTEVHHLWHGELENRRSRQRHLDLARFGFNPDHDIAAAADGTWRWSSAKPELHAYLREYFAGRREDG